MKKKMLVTIVLAISVSYCLFVCLFCFQYSGLTKCVTLLAKILNRRHERNNWRHEVTRSQASMKYYYISLSDRNFRRGHMWICGVAVSPMLIFLHCFAVISKSTVCGVSDLKLRHSGKRNNSDLLTLCGVVIWFI